jgi:hypothetical protein
MDNQYILSQLTNENEIAVFKSMRTDMATAKALLNEEQFAQFMHAATINQTILNDASFRRMNSTSQVVSSTKVNGRVLQNGYKTVTTKNDTTNDNLTPADIDFGKAELNATKLKALTSILDDDKEDNIEREQFEQTLLTMMGEAVGIDLEAVCVFGDTTYTSGSPAVADPLFSCIDGWLKSATTTLKSDGAKGSGTKDFDLTDGITAMFDEMLYAMPAAYRQANLMKDLVYYVPFEVQEAYREFLIDRETGLGDSSLLNAEELQYKGIPVKYAPVLDAADGRTVHGNVASILTVPEFLWYGVYKDISVEPKRIVEEENTEYYYRFRGDATVQFADSVIVADITAAEAAALL